MFAVQRKIGDIITGLYRCPRCSKNCRSLVYQGYKNGLWACSNCDRAAKADVAKIKEVA